MAVTALIEVKQDASIAALIEESFDLRICVLKKLVQIFRTNMQPRTSLREIGLATSLTKRLVNHARPQDVTEGYAADWTSEQLLRGAQAVADRIDELMFPVNNAVHQDGLD